MHAIRGTFRCVGCRTTLFSTDELLGPEAHYLAFEEPIAVNRVIAHGNRLVCSGCDAALGVRRGDDPPRYLIDTGTVTLTPS